jgi:hypothetical protein
LGTFADFQSGHGLRTDAQLCGDIGLGQAAQNTCSTQLGAELVWETDDVHGINLQVE